jgi:hypothetical protein
MGLREHATVTDKYVLYPEIVIHRRTPKTLLFNLQSPAADATLGRDQEDPRSIRNPKNRAKRFVLCPPGSTSVLNLI